MIIVREYVRIGKPPARIKTDFPVNWWEFIKDDEVQVQGTINQYCFGCAEKKILKYKISRIIQAGKTGDRCYLCLKIKNIPEYKFADQAPYQTIEEWTDDGEPIPPVEHIIGDFANAIIQVEVDTDLYGYNPEIERLNPKTLLEIWRGYCRDGEYVRPDILTAAIASMLEDEIDMIKKNLYWKYDTDKRIKYMASQILG